MLVSKVFYNNEDKMRFQHLLYEVLTETTLAQPIMSS